MKKIALIVALAAAAVPAVASAKTYDIASSYGTANFTYGSAVGSVFTPFTQTYTSCFLANLSCKTNSGDSGVPSVIVNNSGGTITFAGNTVTLPDGKLMVHPGQTDLLSNPIDVVLRFIAPVASVYTFGGAFTQYDNQNGGNGTIRTVSSNGVTYSNVTTDGKSFNSSTSFGGTVKLAAGQALDFRVNNNGDYSYDSTGVSGVISYVPEPGVWAMMILGMGAVGGIMRRRKSVTRPAFA